MRLFRTVFEILSLIFQKLKRSRDSDHAYFRNGLLTVGWNSLCSTHIPNLKCLQLLTTKIWKETDNVKIPVLSPPPLLGLSGNAQGSCMTRWNAHCRLPISDNCTSRALTAIKRNLSKSAFSEAVGHFERKYAIAVPSVYRLSVCRLSVTLVRPTQPVEIFGNVSSPFGTWQSVDIHGKYYADRPRGTPPSGGLNATG